LNLLAKCALHHSRTIGNLALSFKMLAKTWRSPQSAATDVVRQVLSDLHRDANEPNAYRDMAAKIANTDGVDEEMRETFRFVVQVQDRTAYGMADVRRDLELKPKTTKPEGGSDD
jgi:hypothetical protein